MSIADTEATEITNAQTTDAVQSETTPAFELRDGKMYVNGTRVYTRDDTNKIASNAKDQAIGQILKELDVDSLDQVRDVITTLKTTTEAGTDKLDVQALKQAVAKREATVEELQTRVSKLQSELVLKDHIQNLSMAMPPAWNADQKAAVLDLMRARSMFSIEGDTFQLRAGSEFLTTDGETPDYTAAVEIVAKTLGLPTGKKGVDLYSADNTGDNAITGKVTPVDDARLRTDVEYRNAYMNIRQFNPNIHRSQITHQQLIKNIDSARKAGRKA
jgi:hypothetical protein